MSFQISGCRVISGPLAVIDIQVTDLTRVPLVSAVEFAADNNAGADTCSYRDEHEILNAAPAAMPLLSDRGQIDVVFNLDRDTEITLQNLLDRNIAPSLQVRSLNDGAGANVCHARHPNRNGQQGRGTKFGLFQHPLDRGGQPSKQ